MDDLRLNLIRIVTPRHALSSPATPDVHLGAWAGSAPARNMLPSPGGAEDGQSSTYSPGALEDWGTLDAAYRPGANGHVLMVAGRIFSCRQIRIRVGQFVGPGKAPSVWLQTQHTFQNAHPPSSRGFQLYRSRTCLRYCKLGNN